MNPIRSLLALCVLISLTLLSAGPVLAQGDGAAERAFSRGDPLPHWVRPAPALPAPAATGPLSIRLADIQFYAAGQGTVYTHRAITAHEASSLGALGQLEIAFQPEYQRVQLHRLRILRGSETLDRLKAASIRFLQRETGFERGIYSGEVTAAIVTDDVRVGDTLEVAYSILGQNPVFEGAFFQGASWDSPYPVALRRVSVNSAPGMPLYYRLVGADGRPGPLPVETDDAGRHILSFEGRNLPAQVGEAAVPDDVHAYRWLQFSQYDSWSAVNAWALRLFDQKVDPAALQPVLKHARAARTRTEAVARVLEFVQTEIRYLSVSLGQNSHKPFPPAQVLARRYGDCKDKSLLMVAMLRELRIDAAPVLVSTSHRKGLDQLLPGPMPFDHAIVRVTVDGKTYFLDPTLMGQYGELARMGQPHGENQVLAIAPGTAGLQAIPRPAELPLSRRSERITVTEPGQPVEMSVKLEMRGADAESARVRLGAMSKEEIRKGFDSLLVKRYPDAQQIGEPVIGDERQQNVVTIALRFRIEQLFTDHGESWGMRYAPSNMNEVFYPPGGARRSFPYAVPNAPSRLAYDFEMRVPNGREVPAAEQTTRVTNPAFQFVHTTSVGGRVYRGSASLDVTADRVAPLAMPAFLADLQKMNEGLSSGFRLYKAESQSAAPAPASPASPAPPPKSVNEQLQASLAAINRAIGDAEVGGRDTSDALCERALVLAYLGQGAQALRDAGKAVQLQPQSYELLRCRAETAFVTGAFRDSEADYTRAIARGADGASPYFGRGLSALFLNRAGAARADFGIAAGKGDGPMRQRALIWSAIAALQDKDQAPPAGTETEPDPDGAWLGAVPAMFAGQHRPDHIVALASRNAGRELDARLTEAYYYGGKYYALKRDRLRARAWLQRALDKQMPNNLFAIAARHELARLGQ